MQFLEDIFSFIKALSMIDLILYFAVLVLIILIISLIYVIKTSEEEETEEFEGHKPLTTAFSLPKSKDKEESKEQMNLKEIVKTIDETPKPLIDMTSYETEQEEKAIISYDELVNTSKFHPINYDGEEMVDNEIKVKKVNLEQITNPNISEEPPKVEVKLFQYEREEAFLKTLQKLNELLN